jgi:uncharacterized protein YggU (UPF0235/DUF167 family)
MHLEIKLAVQAPAVDGKENTAVIKEKTLQEKLEELMGEAKLL